VFFFFFKKSNIILVPILTLNFFYHIAKIHIQMQ